jgi:hypothetical protein
MGSRYLVTKYETYEYDVEAIKAEFPGELAQCLEDGDTEEDFIEEAVPELIGGNNVGKLVWLVESDADEDWE